VRQPMSVAWHLARAKVKVPGGGEGRGAEGWEAGQVRQDGSRGVHYALHVGWLDVHYIV